MWRGAGALAIVLMLALAACTRGGDFGRPKPPLFGEDVFAIGDPLAPGLVLPGPSHLPLNDDERELRNQAYALIVPPNDRELWIRPAAELGFGGWALNGSLDRTAYGDWLLAKPYRSSSARYARLMEDIGSDLARIDPFFATARRVADLDVKRERSLAYVSKLTPGEHAAVRARIAENATIIARVQRALVERAAAYRYALERLVITVPSPFAVEAERVLVVFESRMRGKVVISAAG